MIKQEFLRRLLAQDEMFDAILVIMTFDFLHARKDEGLILVTQFLLCVVPEDDPVFVEETGYCLGDLIHSVILPVIGGL